MTEFFATVGLVAIIGGACMMVSYLFANRRPVRASLPTIPEGIPVRLVSPSGVYRSHFLRVSKKGLVFSAPIQRNSHVPIRVEESLLVQLPLQDGVLTFRSPVVARLVEGHEITIAFPTSTRLVDRRSETRDHECSGAAITVNGELATLNDLSAGGARVLVKEFIKAGEIVRLKLPSGMGEVIGWVLESSAGTDGLFSARHLRIQFESPLAGLSLSRHNHLFLSP